MRGTVNHDLEATMRVRIIGPNDKAIDVLCVIDTGFSGSLTLPQRLVDELDLRWFSQQDTELADGRIITTDVFTGIIDWGGSLLSIEVEGAETAPLLGMSLLNGFELRVQVIRGGNVIVDPIR